MHVVQDTYFQIYIIFLSFQKKILVHVLSCVTVECVCVCVVCLCVCVCVSVNVT